MPTTTVFPQLRNWAKGNRFSAAHLQQPVDALNALALSAGRESAEQAIGHEGWPGTIVDKGPNNETLASVSAKGEQYWVQRNFIKGAQPTAPVTLGKDPAGGSYDDTVSTSATSPGGAIFLVSNLRELAYHGHSLGLGDIVWVFARYDDGLTSVQNSGSGSDTSPPDNQKRYLMSEPVRPLLKLTATVTKPGSYTAQILKTPTTLPLSTDSSQLADADFGTADTTTTVLAINEQEKAVGGHALAVFPLQAYGDFRGINSAGVPVFAINEC